MLFISHSFNDIFDIVPGFGLIKMGLKISKSKIGKKYPVHIISVERILINERHKLNGKTSHIHGSKDLILRQ